MSAESLGCPTRAAAVFKQTTQHTLSNTKVVFSRHMFATKYCQRKPQNELNFGRTTQATLNFTFQCSLRCNTVCLKFSHHFQQVEMHQGNTKLCVAGNGSQHCLLDIRFHVFINLQQCLSHYEVYLSLTFNDPIHLHQ